MKEFSPVYRHEGTAALKTTLYPPYEDTCRIIAFPGCSPLSNQDVDNPFNEKRTRCKERSLYRSLEGIPFNSMSEKRTLCVGLFIGSISLFFAFI